MSTRHRNEHVEMLEQGDIFLLDWPEAENRLAEAEQPQCFYLLMRPLGWCNHRLIHINKKSGGQKEVHYSGVVDEIVRSDRTLSEHFAAIKQESKRFDHPPLTLMRLVGMGEYQLVRAGNHTELAYELISPQQCNELKGDQSPCPSASYLIGVKNPQATETAPLSQEHYGGEGFVNADPVDLLNREGVELLLINTENAHP